MKNAIERLAGWAATATAASYPEQWQQARHWATVGLVDTVGCMIGGSDHPSSQLAYATVAAWGGGRATAVLKPHPLPPPWAALVNATSAHALDFNAWDELSASHSIPVHWAGLLAIGEAEGKTGAELIDAFIVGMEVTMRIGAAVNLVHYHMGWHTTTTVAAIGAAAGCARLLGLDAAGIGHAISIATSQAAGYKSQFGTPMKPVHCGFGAKVGVLSAYLAKSGLAGSTATLDGAWSFLSLQAGERAPGFASALADLGETLLLAKHGLVIKPYPSCAYTHRSIDGLLDLQAAWGLTAANVAHISAKIPYYNASILPYTHPTDDTQARFCMAYCLAVALLHGKVTPESFSEGMLFDPAVRQLLDSIVLETHPIGENSSDLATQETAVITVTLHDGRQLTQSVEYARGMPQRPLSTAELVAKFVGLAQEKVDVAAIEQLLGQLWQFAEVAEITAVLQPLTLQGDKVDS